MVSSILRRKFFEPLYYRKNQSPFLNYWKKLEKTQYLSLQELKVIQWQRLKDIYSFLWKHNTFYRNRFQNIGLTETSLKSPDDITKLPLLTKKEIRENSDKLISDGFNKKTLLHFKTGGSTGKALDIYITEGCSELRNACARRHDRWTGWEPGEPIGAVWGNPKLPKTAKGKIFHHFLKPYIYCDTMAVTLDSVEKFANEWDIVQPTMLYGHAHSIFILAQYIQSLGYDQIKPKGILSTSMMLLPHERKVIENVFFCKVTDRYGCEEVSLIGCECEQHNGMHMNIEHLVIEFVGEDGSPANPGEPGKIVVTDLMNKAMPFIRYQVEDVGLPMNTQCSCGRGLPLMGNVVGRLADFLVRQDGTKIAGISLIENTLTDLPGIDQMQIIQNNLEDIRINIVPSLNFDGSVKSALSNYFKKTFPGATISINFVKMIRSEPSGKYRFSICHIPDGR
ncbi:MAG: hypothetical protein QTN59_19375 [Candidatus Electrothrix communis]|nr:MAG: hypothetical protein QTN59_19375 [Candidatus Electrothrix communis]